jgi:hypothetical protein
MLPVGSPGSNEAAQSYGFTGGPVMPGLRSTPKRGRDTALRCRQQVYQCHLLYVTAGERSKLPKRLPAVVLT